LTETKVHTYILTRNSNQQNTVVHLLRFFHLFRVYYK